MTLEIPGYRIVRELGKGGMATVYLAVQEIFERQVALKVMSKSLAQDPSFGQRFLREARIVSQLAHPNIISVYDAGVHEEAYYLSMEYIAGPDLKQARESLSVVQKIQILRDIALALDFAGRKGYVHRDIKPENILLREGLSAVLMDFGIARAAESDLSVTQTGMALGTPHYMSPEQAKGQAVDHRSDLYSLGVVFYYLLMGTVPYHADSAVAIGVKHLTEPVPGLSEPWVPLQPILDRLMAKKPEERFQSAGELVAALDRLDMEALTRHQQSWQDAVGNVDPAAATQLQPSVSSTTQVTALERVKSLRWQYKVVAGAAALTLFAAVVIISRPFSEDAPPARAVEKPSAVESREADKPESLRQIQSEPDPLDTTEPVPASTGAPHIITLGDIADREYRPVSTQSRTDIPPINALHRLRDRLQDMTGRRPMRELTLEEKVEELRTALGRDPNNLETQRQLAWLAAQYFKKANQFFNEADFVSAQAALDRSRALFPEYLAQHDQLAERLRKRDRLERLLNQARIQFEAGKLVSPWRHNAVHYFRAALNTDAEVTAAQRGLDQVENALLAQARSALAAGDWKRAENAVEAVQDFRPNSEAARQLSYKIEQYRERGSRSMQVEEPARDSQTVSLRQGTPVEAASGAGPIIRQLRVDGRLLSDMNARQMQSVPAQKVLFVSFEYEGFAGDQKLQAELRDGKGKSLQRLSVSLPQKKGLSRFRFEQARDSFPPGEYAISLSWEGNELIQANFLVE